MWRPDQIVIDRLTARAEADLPGGGAALRLRLARALDAASLNPGSMPPSGVLIIRRVSRQLPVAEGAWASALDGLTAGLWERAGRPAEGPVPASAEAVRFADEAEMLAFLAMDVSTGVAWSRWWWQAVLRQYQVASAADVRQLLAREPQLQPAVWHHLAVQGQAETVAGAVTPGDAMQAMALLARTFGVDGWGVGFGAGGRPAPAPWPEAWVGRGQVARLGAERAGLVGFALSLHRRPGRTASAGWVHAFRAWWAGARSAARDGADLASQTQAGADSSPQPGAPSDTFPQPGIPSDEFPQPGTPSDTFAQPETPSDAILQPRPPSDAFPQPGTPSHAFPQPGTPSDAILQPKTPSDAFPQPGTPSDDFPQPGTPSDVFLQPGTPSDTFAQPRTPSHAFPQPGTPSDAFPQPETPSDAFSHPGTPSDAFPQPRTPSDAFPQPRTPSDDFSQPRTPSDDFPQPRTPSDTFAQPGTPSDAFPQPGTPSDAFLQPRTPSNAFPQPGTPSDAFPQPRTPSNAFPQPSDSFPQPGTSSDPFSQPETPSDAFPQPGTPSDSVSQPQPHAHHISQRSATRPLAQGRPNTSPPTPADITTQGEGALPEAETHDSELHGAPSQSLVRSIEPPRPAHPRELVSPHTDVLTDSDQSMPLPAEAEQQIHAGPATQPLDTSRPAAQHLGQSLPAIQPLGQSRPAEAPRIDARQPDANDHAPTSGDEASETPPTPTQRTAGDTPRSMGPDILTPARPHQPADAAIRPESPPNSTVQPNLQQADKLHTVAPWRSQAEQQSHALPTASGDQQDHASPTAQGDQQGQAPPTPRGDHHGHASPTAQGHQQDHAGPNARDGQQSHAGLIARDGQQSHALPAARDGQQSHALPAARDDQQDHAPPTTQGDQQGQAPPTARGDQQGQPPPTTRSDQQDQAPPTARGDQQGHASPTARDDQQDHAPPTAQDDQQGQAPPTAWGDQQGHASPTAWGDQQGHASPTARGDQQGHASPTTRGNQQDHSSPTTRGNQQDHSSPTAHPRNLPLPADILQTNALLAETGGLVRSERSAPRSAETPPTEPRQTADESPGSNTSDGLTLPDSHNLQAAETSSSAPLQAPNQPYPQSQPERRTDAELQSPTSQSLNQSLPGARPQTDTLRAETDGPVHPTPSAPQSAETPPTEPLQTADESQGSNTSDGLTLPNSHNLQATKTGSSAPLQAPNQLYPQSQPGRRADAELQSPTSQSLNQSLPAGRSQTDALRAETDGPVHPSQSTSQSTETPPTETLRTAGKAPGHITSDDLTLPGPRQRQAAAPGPDHSPQQQPERRAGAEPQRRAMPTAQPHSQALPDDNPETDATNTDQHRLVLANPGESQPAERPPADSPRTAGERSGRITSDGLAMPGPHQLQAAATAPPRSPDPLNPLRPPGAEQQSQTQRPDADQRTETLENRAGDHAERHANRPQQGPATPGAVPEAMARPVGLAPADAEQSLPGPAPAKRPEHPAAPIQPHGQSMPLDASPDPDYLAPVTERDSHPPEPSQTEADQATGEDAGMALETIPPLARAAYRDEALTSGDHALTPPLEPQATSTTDSGAARARPLGQMPTQNQQGVSASTPEQPGQVRRLDDAQQLEACVSTQPEQASGSPPPPTAGFATPDAPDAEAMAQPRHPTPTASERTAPTNQLASQPVQADAPPPIGSDADYTPRAERGITQRAEMPQIEAPHPTGEAPVIMTAPPVASEVESATPSTAKTMHRDHPPGKTPPGAAPHPSASQPAPTEAEQIAPRPPDTAHSSPPHAAAEAPGQAIPTDQPGTPFLRADASHGPTRPPDAPEGAHLQEPADDPRLQDRRLPAPETLQSEPPGAAAQTGAHPSTGPSPHPLHTGAEPPSETPGLSNWGGQAQEHPTHPTSDPADAGASTASPPTRAATSLQLTRHSLEDGISTRLGGMLYLINLMQDLNLPHAFADDWLPAEAIGPWAVLEAIARTLLSAAAPPALESDPIWPVLALLDDRQPGHPPGADLPSPPAPLPYRIPPSWITLARPAAEQLRWDTHSTRLRAWVDGSFMLLDVPGQPIPPADQAHRELGGDLPFPATAAPPGDIPPLGTCTGWPIDPLPAPLLEWLRYAGPFIQSDLCRRLNLKDPADLVQSLLLLPARLHVTSSHIDLVTRLENASLPVRAAGLDRDPSWQRNFGKVIQFHFK